MKTTVTSIAIITSLMAAGAEEVAHRVEIRKIETQIQQTPEFQVSGVKDKPIDPDNPFAAALMGLKDKS